MRTLDYCGAECYKLTHRFYPLGFLIAMFLGEALLVAGWVFTNSRGNDIGFATGAGVMLGMLGVGFYCTILIGDMIFSDQYKLNTLKNEVSYGTPRPLIYLGKLAVSCAAALILCIVVVAFYVGLCWLCLPHDPALDGETLSTLGYCIAVAIPVWLGAQGFVMALFFLIRSATVVSIVAAVLFMGAGQILQLLGALVHPIFSTLYDILLTTPIDTITNTNPWDWGFIGISWAIGLGWFAVSTGVGLLAFQKKEIN